jgi:GxxExxY protein
MMRRVGCCGVILSCSMMEKTDGLIHQDLTGRILGVFYRVYNELGSGFLEAVYEHAVTKELRAEGLKADRQIPITVSYRGQPAGLFRADIVVEGQVVLELKARSQIYPIHEVQLLNFLRASPFEVGLLLNFGPEPRFKRLVFSNKRKAPLSKRH